MKWRNVQRLYTIVHPFKINCPYDIIFYLLRTSVHYLFDDYAIILQHELKEVIMKYLLSIVLLALIGVTTPKKTTPAYDWGRCVCKSRIYRGPIRWGRRGLRKTQNGMPESSGCGMTLPYLVLLLSRPLLMLVTNREEHGSCCPGYYK